MKKPIFSFLIVIVVLLGINFVLAKDSPNGQPFDFLWESVNSLVEQVSGQQGQIDEQQEQISNQQTQIDNILERIEELEAKECVPGFTESCDTGLLGVCSVGTRTCSQNQIWGTCIQNIQPSLEVLDDLDNNCDGFIDNDITLQPIIRDNFNSYINGDLAGQGGWSGDRDFDVQGDIVYEGEKAIRANINSGDNVVEIYRELFGGQLSEGIQAFYVRIDSYGRDRIGFYLLENSTIITGIRAKDPGNHLWGRSFGGYEIDLGEYFLNTWILGQIEWRSYPNHQVRFRINNGVWSDWLSPENDWVVGPNGLFIYGWGGEGSFTVYYDNLY